MGPRTGVRNRWFNTRTGGTRSWVRSRRKLHEPRRACVNQLVDLIERLKHRSSVQIGSIFSNQRSQCLLSLRGLALGRKESHFNEPTAQQVSPDVFCLASE